MRDASWIAVCGELAIEISPTEALDHLPEANRTMVLDSGSVRVGGAAFDLSRQLHALGEKPHLISVVGEESRPQVAQACDAAGVDRRSLIDGGGPADVMFFVRMADGFRSLYMRNPCTEEQANGLAAAAREAKMVILSGSRHAALRQAYCRLAREFSGDLLVFAPNESLFSYEFGEIVYICHHAGLVAVNEREAHHLVGVLGALGGDAALAAKVPGMLLITRAGHGADLYTQSAHWGISSLASNKGDVLGAGTTFLAAFLSAWRKAVPLEDALGFATAAAAVYIDAGEDRQPVTADRIESRLAASHA